MHIIHHEVLWHYLDSLLRLHFHFSLSCIGEENGRLPPMGVFINTCSVNEWGCQREAPESEVQDRAVGEMGEAGPLSAPQPWEVIMDRCSHPSFPGGTRGKEPACQCRRHKRRESIPGTGRSPGERHGNPLLFLPGESHGQRSLVGCSP